jgi:hypothetical protein
MSYLVGQIRRNQISSFSTDVNYTSNVESNNPYLAIDGTLSANVSYYLQFKVKQGDERENFILKLKNEAIEQSVQTFHVTKGNDYTTFELIFTPNRTYSKVAFELNREDANDANKVLDIEILNFYLVKNIVTELQSKFSGLKKLKKIGIQGPPGLLFVLDGDEIRIGKTGIYELYNDSITVAYLGFCIKESNQTFDGKDFFILDFTYQGGGNE